MPFNVKCPSCAAVLAISETMPSGGSVRCPKCTTVLRVPARSSATANAPPTKAAAPTFKPASPPAMPGPQAAPPAVPQSSPPRSQAAPPPTPQAIKPSPPPPSVEVSIANEIIDEDAAELPPKAKPKSNKKLLFGILGCVGLLFLACGGTVTYGVYKIFKAGKETVQQIKDEFGNQPVPGINESGDRPPPDFSLSAEAFHDEVTDNITAAGKKYGGRVVELKGKVTLIGRHPLDPNALPQVTLGDFQHIVLCNTVDKAPWLKCVPGQTVKVRGRVNRAHLFAGVVLESCEISEVSGDPAIPLRVTQLVKEIAEDERAAQKKYDAKSVFLSGEFVAYKKTSDGKMVELKGDGKRPIYCQAWMGDAPFLKMLKPGEPVTFLGTLRVHNAGISKLVDDKVELRGATLTQASILPP